MSNTREMALEKAFPRKTRDAITTFAIENRPVMDVLRNVLDYASTNINKLPRNLREPHVHLLGGSEQLQILFQIATECGFQLENSDEDTEVILQVPNQDLRVRIACDITADADLAKYRMSVI